MAQGELLYGQGENDTVVFVPELDHAAAYFADKKQFGKAAHAALYNGYAQLAAQDKATAMHSFREAEEFGHLANDSLTVAWAQYETGFLLFYESRVEESLHLFKVSEKGFGANHEGRALAINMMACCHLARQQYDSAIVCLDQSMVYADQAKSDVAKRKVLNNYSALYMLLGDHEKSVGCLNQIRREIPNPDLALLYLNLGNVYFGFGNKDSAAFYYQLCEELLPSTKVKDETKASAYGAFSRFAEKHGNLSKALEYERRHGDMVRRILEKRGEENVYRIQRRYDFEALRNEVEIKDAHRQRDIALLCIALMLAVFAVLIVIRKLRQKGIQSEMLQKELEKLKQTSVDASVLNEELSWHLSLLSKIKQTKEKSEMAVSVKQGSIEKFILGKKSLFEASLEILGKAYPDLYQLICQRYPDLSETEAKVCLLSCWNLSNNEIANLLEMSIHTINKCRSSIYKKLELDSSDSKGLVKKVITLPQQQ